MTEIFFNNHRRPSNSINSSSSYIVARSLGRNGSVKLSKTLGQIFFNTPPSHHLIHTKRFRLERSSYRPVLGWRNDWTTTSERYGVKRSRIIGKSSQEYRRKKRTPRLINVTLASIKSNYKSRKVAKKKCIVFQFIL